MAVSACPVVGVPRNFQSGNKGGVACIDFRSELDLNSGWKIPEFLPTVNCETWDGVPPELAFQQPTLKQIDRSAIARISLESLVVFSTANSSLRETPVTQRRTKMDFSFFLAGSTACLDILGFSLMVL